MRGCVQEDSMFVWVFVCWAWKGLFGFDGSTTTWEGIVISLEFENGTVSAGIASQHFGGVNWGIIQ